MIQINEVTKQFKDKKKYVTALKHVTFEVKKGKLLVFLVKMEQVKQLYFERLRHC